MSNKVVSTKKNKRNLCFIVWTILGQQPHKPPGSQQKFFKRAKKSAKMDRKRKRDEDVDPNPQHTKY